MSTRDTTKTDPAAAVLAVMDGAINRESNYVEDWPKDERHLYRNGDWRSFEERSQALSLLRARKIVAAVTAASLPTPPRPYDDRPPCGDCGPGYRLGDDGCRHDGDKPQLGDTGICRTCAQPIWWEEGEVGHRKVVDWSDRITRGGDSIVCFKDVGYRHVPMGAREAAIYAAGFKAGQEADQ